MKKQIQRTLYVSDLDGTMLDANHCISEPSRSLLSALLKEGLMFLPATARNYASASELLQGLAYKGDYVLSNGAFVANHRGQTLLATSFSQSTVEALHEAMQTYSNCEVWTSLEGANHLQLPYKPSHEVMQFVRHRQSKGFNAFVESLTQTFKAPKQAIALTYMLPRSAADQALAVLKDHNSLNDLNAQVMPYPGIEGVYTLTVQPSGVDKGQAVKNWLNLNRTYRGAWPTIERLVIFGDQENDRGMFGLKESLDLQVQVETYAVQKACDSLKSLATAVIGSNEDHAVARFIACDAQQNHI